MKTFVVVTLITVTIPAIWARPVRRSGHEVSVTRVGTSSHARAKVRLNGIRTARPKAAPPPAPGVVQLHKEEGYIFAYFKATSLIPANSTIGGYVAVYNGDQTAGDISFDDVQINYDMQPGDYLTLPNFSSLGDLWPTGDFVYTVDVTINGVLTETNGEIFVNQALSYDDLPNYPPVITGTSQSVAASRDVILSIYGMFTSDTPLVVMETLVVPARAIRLVSPNQVNVDLSLVPGLDLTHLYEYLLTVSQGGYADSTIYRFVPEEPGTFTPAP